VSHRTSSDVLDAITDHVAGPAGTTLEPTANYGVVRGNQDFHGGAGSVGFIVTGVNRSLDTTSARYLHRDAYSGGIDARWRFRGRYEVSGSMDLSRVEGGPAQVDGRSTVELGRSRFRRPYRASNWSATSEPTW